MGAGPDLGQGHQNRLLDDQCDGRDRRQAGLCRAAAASDGVRHMCGRAKLETDVSEIKIAFRIPPEYPTPNFAPSWSCAHRHIEYVGTMDRFARRFLAAVAVALDLPPDWFDTAFKDSQFSFRLSHYPPVAAEPNQFGIAPHTDSNFMTFLAQTEVPGLQVRMPGGDWLDVPYIPGSFAVNSGDMLRRWSNARFKSTPHRALPPVGQERYAIPFFLGPRFDQRIECLPTCTGPDNPPRWEPITYAEWQEYWYDANYDPKLQRDVA